MGNIAFERARRKSAAPENSITLLGTLDRVTAQGEIFVDFPGNTAGPLLARVLLPAGSIHCGDWSAGDSVMLLLGAGESLLPVVLGRVADRLPEATVTMGNLQRDLTVDGRRVVLEAHSEVVLRCGPASITLNAAGKIVIKGAEIVSRSSGTNKIKGTLVNIN